MIGLNLILCFLVDNDLDCNERNLGILWLIRGI